jgi:Flp pilus assembly protein TadD
MPTRIIMVVLMFATAVSLGLIAYQLGNRPAAPAATAIVQAAPPAPPLPYLVASRPLSPGTLARIDDFTMRSAPANAILPGAIIDTPDARAEVRSSLTRNDKLDDAEGVLQRRLKTTPRDVDLLRTLGAVQVMAGKPSQAVLTLSSVLIAKPDDVKAMVDKAVALDILRRHNEAQVLYRQALALSPGDAAVSNDLALSLLLSGQPAAADLVLAPFRDSAGLPERIRTNLGIMDAASGRPADAHAMLGSRIDAADLASLTQAINEGTGRP